MIQEIVIDDQDENVYDLSSIGLNGELIINDEEKYIMVEDGFFVFSSIDNFKKVDDFYVLNNEDSSFKISADKFDLIKNILNS